MYLRANRSYSETMAKTGGITQLMATRNLSQFYLVSAARHQARGGSFSTNAMALICLYKSIPGVELVKGLRKSDTKSPLSETTQTPSLFTACLYTVLDHAMAASAPAEVPESTIFLAENSLYFQFRYWKCWRVLFMPRKNRVVPWQEISLLRVPWCSTPSQQGTKTLVQLQQRGLTFLRLDMMVKSARSTMGSQNLELPRAVLDLCTQSDSVCSRVMPEHMPPPSKQIRKLLVSPSLTQSALGLPSRHRALESAGCLCSRYSE